MGVRKFINCIIYILKSSCTFSFHGKPMVVFRCVIPSLFLCIYVIHLKKLHRLYSVSSFIFFILHYAFEHFLISLKKICGNILQLYNLLLKCYLSTQYIFGIVNAEVCIDIKYLFILVYFLINSFKNEISDTHCQRLSRNVLIYHPTKNILECFLILLYY